MNEFAGKHFKGEFILWAVRWYCKYGVSYRELEEMLRERGLEVDHTTIYRWVQIYSPKLKKKLAWCYRNQFGHSWQVDETYVKVSGRWVYLYRAIDRFGDTIDFYLSTKRNKIAAKRFLQKAFSGCKSYAYPETINTDKHQSYKAAI